MTYRELLHALLDVDRDTLDDEVSFAMFNDDDSRTLFSMVEVDAAAGETTIYVEAAPTPVEA